MKNYNKEIEHSISSSDKDSIADSNSEIEEETIEDIKPPVKKGKGNHVMTEARLSQLALARSKAALLRTQINESKGEPVKKEPKKSKLQLKLENLQMNKNKPEADVEPNEPIDLRKTIRKVIQPLEHEEPVIHEKPAHITIPKKPFEKINGFYYM